MNNINCKICNKICSGFVGLGTHLSKIHHNLSVNEYYDLYMKNENEGKCIICKLPTEFKNLSEGYRKACSHNCSRKMMNLPEARRKSKNTCLEKYGVEFVSQIEDVRIKNSEIKKIQNSNPEYRKMISEKTKEAMWMPEIREKYLRGRSKPLTPEVRKLMSDLGKERLKNPNIRERIYTKSRNEKISISKKHYWDTHPEERKRIMDIWKNKRESSLETKMYNFLLLQNIKFVKRYEVDQRQYDAYLPDHNILLEFDGEFWHKQSLEECKYPFQIFNYYNDLYKDEIAKKNNIPLYRIRETESPNKILEYIGVNK